MTCPDGCLTCTKEVCITCQNNQPPPCTVAPTCMANFYFDSSNNTCAPCMAPCETCTGPTTNQCSSCLSGYYLEGTSCPACSSAIFQCVSCSTKIACRQCASEYYLNSSNTCSSCQPTCKTCTALNQCSVLFTLSLRAA